MAAERGTAGNLVVLGVEHVPAVVVAVHEILCFGFTDHVLTLGHHERFVAVHVGPGSIVVVVDVACGAEGGIHIELVVAVGEALDCLLHVEGCVPRFGRRHHFLDTAGGECASFLRIFPSVEAVVQVGIHEHIGNLVASLVTVLLGRLPQLVHKLSLGH